MNAAHQGLARPWGRDASTALSVLLPYNRTQRPALGNWRPIWSTRKLSRSACAERSCAGKKDCCSTSGSVAPSQPLPSPVETRPEVVKLSDPDSAP
jgi:hypothetical protein